MVIKNITAALLASAFCYMTADAIEVSMREFNYASEAVIQWGTGLMESYDVAIRLDGRDFKGDEILSISMPLADTSALSDISIWFSNSLILENKENKPDIKVIKPEIEANRIFIDLKNPIIIPESGIYIGCTFTVTNLTAETKVPLSISKDGNENSFFIHSSRKYTKWGNHNVGFALDMNVTLKGVFQSDAIELVECLEGNVGSEETWVPEILVRNIGEKNCSRLDYSIIIDDGEPLYATLNLTTPLKPSYTQSALLKLNQIPAPEAGNHHWRISLDGVNWEVNQCNQRSESGLLYVWPYLPKRTPLMEEYTGTWCGWCPRGAIGLGLMERKYGDEFVAMAYHTDSSKDPMVTSAQPTTSYEGAPWGILDRKLDADAFFGLLEYCSSFEEGIEAAWLQQREYPSPVEIEAEAYWKDTAEKVEIEVSSTIRFVRAYPDSDIRLGVFLIADHLKGSSKEWLQKNYYSGLSQYANGDLKVLYEEPKILTDYEYNHVLIYTPDAYGIKGSLPSNIEWLRNYPSITEIDTKLAVNTENESLIQNKNNLKVILSVIDASNNTILNSKLLRISERSGIETIGQNEILSISYYDLQGRCVKTVKGNSIWDFKNESHLNNGIYFKVITYSDGNIKTISFRDK